MRKPNTVFCDSCHDEMKEADAFIFCFDKPKDRSRFGPGKIQYCKTCHTQLKQSFRNKFNCELINLHKPVARNEIDIRKKLAAFGWYIVTVPGQYCVVHCIRTSKVISPELRSILHVRLWLNEILSSLLKGSV